MTTAGDDPGVLFPRCASTTNRSSPSSPWRAARTSPTSPPRGSPSSASPSPSRVRRQVSHRQVVPAQPPPRSPGKGLWRGGDGPGVHAVSAVALHDGRQRTRRARARHGGNRRARRRERARRAHLRAGGPPLLGLCVQLHVPPGRGGRADPQPHDAHHRGGRRRRAPLADLLLGAARLCAPARRRRGQAHEPRSLPRAGAAHGRREQVRHLARRSRPSSRSATSSPCRACTRATTRSGSTRRPPPFRPSSSRTSTPSAPTCAPTAARCARAAPT